MTLDVINLVLCEQPLYTLCESSDDGLLLLEGLVY
jgi:hypothetical protein